MRLNAFSGHDGNRLPSINALHELSYIVGHERARSFCFNVPCLFCEY
jgi:hypothetical protein